MVRATSIANPLLIALLFAASVCGVEVAAPLPDWNQAGEESVRNLTGILQIDTSDGNETQVARYLKAVLDKEGIPSEILELKPGRGNLVARLRGNGSKRPLLLMGHTDVVGVEPEKWTEKPFGAEIKDGYLYGRGAQDNKDNVAVYLEVFLLLHRLGVPLERDVIFLAQAGEESSSSVGIGFMVARAGCVGGKSSQAGRAAAPFAAKAEEVKLPRFHPDDSRFAMTAPYRKNLIEV